MIIYGIKNCDTVRKARKWLEQHGISHDYHDFREDGLSREILDRWLAGLDWQEIFNKKSTTYRQLPASTRERLDQDIARQLMLDYPTLIKRPVLEHKQGLLLGFSAEQYSRFTNC